MNSKLQKKVSGNIGNLANNCLGSGNFIANSIIYQHEIIVHVDENIVSPFNNSNGVTAPTKTILTEIEFDPFEQIYYYDSTVTVSTSSFVSANSLYYTMDSLDLRYSFNIESPLEANKNVYLKTNLQFGQKVKLDADTPLVQELEDATDEVWYILIGRAIDDYHISLYLDKKIFHSDGSEVVFHDHDDRYYTQPEVDSKVTPMYGYCETAAATVAKTVTISNFTLITGRTIFIKFKYANTATNPTLNVNGTGAKRIYRWGTTSAGTTAATNGWQANSVIALTYDGTGWIEHLWQNSQYNMATNYLGTGGYTADSVVYRYKILVHLDKDTLSPLNNTDSIVSPTKTILTDIEFDPFSQIYYYDSTTVINAGDLIAGTAIAYTFNNIDLRQTFNIDDSNNPLTLNKNVYMKVIPLSNGKVKIASEMPLVQELPTSNDGYWYIFLGRAATRTYGLSLYPEKPVFYHDGTQIRQKFNPYMEYALNENAIQGTASGDIVSFDDGIESPVIDLKVAIEPTQDLHGYDAPWPAGGGTNIWDEQWEVGIWDQNGEKSDRNNAIRSINYISVIPATSYFIYFSNTIYTRGLIIRAYDNNKIFLRTKTVDDNPQVISSDNDEYYWTICSYSLDNVITYNNNISINYPSTITTYQPYSNVCPISGWTGANVQRTGKSLSNFEQGGMNKGINRNSNTNRIRTKNYIPYKQNKPIYINYNSNYSDEEIKVKIQYYDKNDYITQHLSEYPVGDNWIISSTTITNIPNNTKFIRLLVGLTSNSSMTPEVGNNNINISYDTNIFEPYTGTTYPISWSTEAGTVYGGSLDVTTGVLTVTHVTHNVPDDILYTRYNEGTTNDRFGLSTEKLAEYGWEIIVPQYATQQFSSHFSVNKSGSSSPFGYFRLTTSWLSIYNNNFEFASPEELQSYLQNQRLAGTPVQICYKIAEPFTYQLTPTEVTTLLGSNRIWADTGNVDVTYVRNTNNGKIITNINNNIKSILNWFGLTYYNNGIYVNPDQGV